MKSRNLFFIVLATELAWAGAAYAVDSRLVYEGPSGLVYNTYTNRNQTVGGHTIPYFLKAGYQGGVVTIPFISLRV